MRFVLRRLGHGLILLGVLSLVTFLLAELAPGDPLSALRLDPSISEETLERLREKYDLDRPWYERYGRWLRSVGQGEFGYSTQYETSVAPLLAPRLRNTLLLMTAASALAWLLALPLGLLAARRPDGFWDRVVRLASAALLATPEILLALGALVLAAWSGLFPVGGMQEFSGSSKVFSGLRNLLWHLALPTLVLGLGLLPVLLLHVTSVVRQVLEEPFLLTARSLGIPPSRQLLFHALPAAAQPLIALFGLTLAGLVSGSLLVEVVLGWPGLGPLLLGAVFARDLHVVLAAGLVSGMFLLLGNLISDLLSAAVDPRWAANQHRGQLA